ncbi:hypothetical protein HDV00_001841 [Rhizophlyctis rosea]|nr:hypothetical protein HDV00_001841 [Rhizophlyctis rosea]
MNEPDRAMSAYESALRHNPYSIPALTQIAALCRAREQYGKTNGEIWGALGHCYLMMDNLQKAYTAYQQALYHLPNPKEPKLWYGIGILYDRYGSYEHAEEAFSAVIRMEPKFEKANEIYFRLGIIYKQQGKYDTSLSCFRYILSCPPKPLTEIDIWFQIGHVYEQQKEYRAAQEAYERVLAENPNHAKVLQQLGWLYHQQNSNFSNQDLAISFLTRSLEADMNDAQTWYLLGRCYMAQQKYNKAYEAYQQAVYRDGRNPTFWCSIGVLYYQINQYRDALDAYSRAIRLNPYISEVWYDLGTLYESCNNQINDALDAYTRASELDPSNPHIKQRLQMLRNAQASGGQVQAGAAQPQQPMPQDMAYPNGSGVHGNSAPQFYTGPAPPNQMSRFPGPSQQDQRPPHGGLLPPPPMDQDRRDVDRRELPPPSHYPPHSQTRDDRPLNSLANEAVRQQQLQQSSGRKQRADHASSPKSQEVRRTGGGRQSGRPALSPTGGDANALPSDSQDDYPGRHMHAPRGSPRLYPAHSIDRPQEGRVADILSRPSDSMSQQPDALRPIESLHHRQSETIPRLPEMHSRLPEGGRAEGRQEGYGSDSRGDAGDDFRHERAGRSDRLSDRFGMEPERGGFRPVERSDHSRTVDYTNRSGESGSRVGEGRLDILTDGHRRSSDSRPESRGRGDAKRRVDRSPSPPPKRESHYDAGESRRVERRHPSTPPRQADTEGERVRRGGSPEDYKNARPSSNGRGRYGSSREWDERDEEEERERDDYQRSEGYQRPVKDEQKQSEQQLGSLDKGRGGDRSSDRSLTQKSEEGSPKGKFSEYAEKTERAGSEGSEDHERAVKGREEHEEEAGRSAPARLPPPSSFADSPSPSPSPPPRDGLAALASYGEETARDRSSTPGEPLSPVDKPESSAPAESVGKRKSDDEETSLKRPFVEEEEEGPQERKRAKNGEEEKGEKDD